VLEHEVHVWRGELDRAASRRALRRVLGYYLNADPEQIELRLGEHGKPALADPTAPLRFNLSHSGGAALIAVARELEVGVDVERIRPRRDPLRLAERALEPAAVEAIRAAAPSERLASFHAAWTRHEAVAKCHGTGLWRPLPATPVAVAELDVGAGFAAALAVAAEAMPPVRLFALAAEPQCDSSDHRLAPTPS
jgi:4'-phosphopantetheinyl transferase